MILVTLGTQDKEFKRLLVEIDNLIDKGIIKDEVVVQSGMTKYESKKMKVFSFIPKDELGKLYDEASLIITHGGVGSILDGIKRGKKVIAVPRLVKYNEHQSDHQIEIINRFNDMNYIYGILDVSELEKALKNIDNFNPNAYKSNNHNMLKLVDDNLKDNSKVMFISSTGGHLEELLQLSPLFEKYDYYLITEKLKHNLKLKDKYKKVGFLIYGTKVHPITYVFKVLANGIISFNMFLKFRPDYIVTTGTHTAIPMCVIAHIFKKKIIYIETFANSNSKTMTGNFLYKHNLYDLFIVQWKEMLKFYPKATYGGWIF